MATVPEKAQCIQCRAYSFAQVAVEGVTGPMASSPPRFSRWLLHPDRNAWPGPLRALLSEAAQDLPPAPEEAMAVSVLDLLHSLRAHRRVGPSQPHFNASQVRCDHQALSFARIGIVVLLEDFVQRRFSVGVPHAESHYHDGSNCLDEPAAHDPHSVVSG